MVQIDTAESVGRVRVFINDGTVYDGDPAVITRARSQVDHPVRTRDHPHVVFGDQVSTHPAARQA